MAAPAGKIGEEITQKESIDIDDLYDDVYALAASLPNNAYKNRIIGFLDELETFDADELLELKQEILEIKKKRKKLEKKELKFSVTGEKWSLEAEQNLADATREGIKNFILEASKNNERFLGEGRTARVFRSPDYFQLCYKIIKHKQYASEAGENLVSEEFRLHNKIFAIKDAYVKVPTPYYYAETSEFHTLVMEALPAVTVESVLKGEHSVPENFDPEEFIKKLENFLIKMHDKFLYHCDLSTFNVLMDLKTGNPCLVDFGRSREVASRGENPYQIEDTATKRIRTFASDELLLAEMRTKLIAFMQAQSQIK